MEIQLNNCIDKTLKIKQSFNGHIRKWPCNINQLLWLQYDDMTKINDEVKPNNNAEIMFLYYKIERKRLNM